MTLTNTSSSETEKLLSLATKLIFKKYRSLLQQSKVLSNSVVYWKRDLPGYVVIDITNSQFWLADLTFKPVGDVSEEELAITADAIQSFIYSVDLITRKIEGSLAKSLPRTKESLLHLQSTVNYLAARLASSYKLRNDRIGFKSFRYPVTKEETMVVTYKTRNNLTEVKVVRVATDDEVVAVDYKLLMKVKSELQELLVKFQA